MSGKYDDIINMSHHVSKTRPRMSNRDRAAQFAPFAALTGHSDAIDETARLTEKKRVLTEDEQQEINRGLQVVYNRLMSAEGRGTEARITHFIPDMLKSGGKYITEKVIVYKIDTYSGRIGVEEGREILFENLVSIG